MKKKKKNTLLKTLLVAVVVLTMSFGAFSSAFADKLQKGTEEYPAEAALTKYLQSAETTIPLDMNFRFYFTKYSYNGDTDDTSRMPDLGSVTATITEDDYVESQGGYYKEVAIGAGSSIEYLFQAAGAGVYTYKVVEDATNSYRVNNATGPEYEELTYSDQVYFVTYQVLNGESGAYISDIAVVKGTGTAGQETPAEVDGDNPEGDADKVDPTPTDPQDPDDPAGNGFEFKNVYVRSNEKPDASQPGPSDMANAALAITKTVTGDAGNKAADAGFTFKVEITLPDTVSDALKTNYTYMVIESDQTMRAMGTIDLSEGSHVIESIEINHGEKLAIAGLPDGTTYKVTETEAKGHTGSATITEAGDTPSSVNEFATSGAAGTVKKADYSATNNIAAVTNNKQSTNVTGIVVDNLPYVGLLVLALGAFIAFVVTKKRRRNQDMA